MQHWLFKTEPETYSIADLKREGHCGWEGIRNYQARNRLRDEVAVGDPVLIYHSNCAEPAVVGLAEVCGAARPDPFQFDPDSKYHDAKATAEQPRWVLVEVAYRETFPRPLSLRAIKADPQFADLELVSRSRLSIQKVGAAQFDAILRLCRG
ncbi:MAG: EVE domain-containing protein [Pseudomonadota bacterium]|jgi:predicted RNA-binding protein with PUA-like domain